MVRAVIYDTGHTAVCPVSLPPDLLDLPVKRQGLLESPCPVKGYQGIVTG